jgi:hypothetical protein
MRFTLAGILAVVVAVAAATVTVNGQAPAQRATSADPVKAPIPRTLDGKPDFTGVWSAFILTPLQRPNGAPEFMTPEQRQALEKEDVEDRKALRIYGTVTPPGGQTVDAYNTLWRDGYWITMNVPFYRTSQVVDPPDGRLPPAANNPQARQWQQERQMRQNRSPWGPEDRPAWSRCIRGQVSGPPLVGTGGSYNNNIQIVQSPTAFAVVQEMNHETQIAWLDGRPRQPDGVQLYKGSSRGRWEGDTLVIDTTNFRPSTLFDPGVMSVGNGSNSDKFKVTERYQMLDGNNILYRFTVEDPALWTRPWSAEFVMWKMADQKMLVEYQCHEHNSGVGNPLSGARALEAQGIKDPVYFGGGGDEEEAVR